MGGMKARGLSKPAKIKGIIIRYGKFEEFCRGWAFCRSGVIEMILPRDFTGTREQLKDFAQVLLHEIDHIVGRLEHKDMVDHWYLNVDWIRSLSMHFLPTVQTIPARCSPRKKKKIKKS